MAWLAGRTGLVFHIHRYVGLCGRPTWTKVTKVCEGGEPVLFQQCFRRWKLPSFLQALEPPPMEEAPAETPSSPATAAAAAQLARAKARARAQLGAEAAVTADAETSIEVGVPSSPRRRRTKQGTGAGDARAGARLRGCSSRPRRGPAVPQATHKTCA